MQIDYSLWEDLGLKPPQSIFGSNDISWYNLLPLYHQTLVQPSKSVVS